MQKKTVTKEIFSKRLKELMDNNHETTYTMAEKFSLSSPTISRYITGQMSPKITTIGAIADYFDVNPAWLMGYDVPKMLTKKIEPLPNGRNSISIMDEKPELKKIYDLLNDFTDEQLKTAARLLLALQDSEDDTPLK